MSKSLTMEKVATESTQLTGLNKLFDDGFMYALTVWPLSRDFGGEWGIDDDVCGDSAVMINVVIVKEGEETANFNIQAAYLLLCTFDAEVHDHTLVVSSLGPFQCSDVLLSIM